MSSKKQKNEIYFVPPDPMIRFKNVLLVDDDTVCNFISQEIIKEIQITGTVSAVTDASEALPFLLENEVDIVLLDLYMPIMNGFEFLDLLNSKYIELRKKLKIVILTSSSSGQDMENMRTRRIDGFIVKPLTRENLLGVVKML